jgi:hypothetical protein
LYWVLSAPVAGLPTEATPGITRVALRLKRLAHADRAAYLAYRVAGSTVIGIVLA